jgi:hypothetical protein
MMAISLGTLSLDAIAPVDLARGDANRAVNAEQVLMEIGTWRRRYDGVAAAFLLIGIYRATLCALMDGKSYGFFCLDDPDRGDVLPGAPGRVRVQLSRDEEHDLSGFAVLSASFEAIAQIANFLATKGHPEGSAILLKELARPTPGARSGHSTEAV